MRTRKPVIVILIASIASVVTGQTPVCPVLPWDQMRNPVYQHADWSVKDACMAHRDGWSYLFFSAFFYDSGRERSHVVCVRTKDFREFSEPLFIWSGMDQGWIGMCSPNLTETDGKFYLTYNSWGDHPERKNQLFYAVSNDLIQWDAIHQPLAASLTSGKRSIDAALTKQEGKWFLVWKEDQTPLIAVCDSLQSNDWRLIGTPAENRWFENAQFLDIDNKVCMLVTSSAHRPYICELSGNPGNPDNWLRWTEFRRLDVEMQSWNTDNISNAAFLADWRKTDGYFYLLYAGRSEKISHKGRGDNKLGLARSSDLKTWECLPE